MTSCVFCSTTIGSSLISKTMHSHRHSSSTTRFIIMSPMGNSNITSRIWVRASMVDSSSDFVRRMEKAWLISQQPRPIACSHCNSKGHIECKWCGGTGFFIIGDNMLCEIPSKNTTCVICTGTGSICCSDCQGTGFRARWLEEPSNTSK